MTIFGRSDPIEFVNRFGRRVGNQVVFGDTYPDNFIIASNYAEAVADGLIPGAVPHAFLGENSDIDSGNLPAGISNVCEIAGLEIYPRSSTADIDSISSSSALDVGKVLLVSGLDANLLEVSQLVILNGQNRVALTTNLIRFREMILVFGDNVVGDIYCYVNSGAVLIGGVPSPVTKIRGMINASVTVLGENRSLHSFVTVPVNKRAKAYVGYYAVSSLVASSIIIAIYIGSNVLGIPYVFGGKTMLRSDGNTTDQPILSPPLVIPGGFDVEFYVLSSSVNNASIFSLINVIFYDN